MTSTDGFLDSYPVHSRVKQSRRQRDAELLNQFISQLTPAPPMGIIHQHPASFQEHLSDVRPVQCAIRGTFQEVNGFAFRFLRHAFRNAEKLRK